MDNSAKISRLNEYLNSLSTDEIEERNRQQIEQDDKDFVGLKEGLDNGSCYYCKQPLTHFSKYKPPPEPVIARYEAISRNAGNPRHVV